MSAELNELGVTEDLRGNPQTASEEIGRLVWPSRFPLPWSHYVRLLPVNNRQARSFYETEALRGGWSVRQLDRQIATQFFEGTQLSRNKAAILRRGHTSDPSEELTLEQENKDPLVLEFLGAKDSNLARTAMRYKIDTAKLSAAVREELSKPVKGTTPMKNKTTKTKSK